MRLTEHEQRLLAELEFALTQEDPRYAAQFTAPAARRGRLSRLARGILRLLRLRR